ncbi:peptidylglycine alpha-hydroxylating monooxygenase-like [Diadema setosum]|uniref:peptidylglycine alpha-hydroxylating monooxygenase-like n=1 Tax=Diadema setosum TaxID=31175 RepID=UPI003B3A5DA0
MAAYQHILLLLALFLVCMGQVFANDRREEWIAALSKLPGLENRFDLGEDVVEEDDDGGDVMGEVPSEFFSYGSSYNLQEPYSVYGQSVEGEAAAVPPDNGTAELRMPNVHPTKPNEYFCHSERMPADQGVYIVGFSPVTTEGTAHHILIYGCKAPGSYAEKSWNCGEMDMAEDELQEDTAPPCETESKILYAWAMDAPPLQLPKAVGFEVGADTGINYLVLQVHYAKVDKFKDGSTDNSGVALTWTTEPQPLRAGVYFMGSDGEIPGKSKDIHLEAACTYEGPQVMHPFAYRVHTHKLGEVVSGYRVRDGTWTEIGKRSPQLPQMFTPIDKDISILPGDDLAMRCTYASDREETTYIGMTGDDEMCNFYIMYYTTEDSLPDDDVCYGNGKYKWSLSFSKTPDKEASSLVSDAQANSM